MTISNSFNDLSSMISPGPELSSSELSGSESSGAEVIRDRAGRCYRMAVSVEGPISRFKLYERSTLVGEAKCVRESPQRMALGDIAIANEAIPTPTNVLMRYVRQLPGLQHHPVNYRGRGLGTALLNRLIDHTRAAGAEELWGEVFQQDIQNSPELLDWYQRLGFERRPPEGDVEVDVVALICLALV